MKIDFQQGIISYPSNGTQQTFLIKNGNYISLEVVNGHVDISFSFGLNNYLFTETVDIINAWGPFSGNVKYWLYWDINLLTAVRTFGITAVPPIYSNNTPTHPVNDQHWYNLSNSKMYIYELGHFREVLRVFAGTVENNTILPVTFNSNISSSYAGSQSGITMHNQSTGKIIVDNVGSPIRRSDGTFFTTEDEFFIEGSPVNAVRLESNILMGTAIQNIAKFFVVKEVSFGKLDFANYDDAGNAAIAILLQDLTTNETGTVCVQGLITNISWNWTKAGAKLWITGNGELTETDPHVSNPITHPIPRVPVGRVWSKTSIIFDQGLGDKGEKGDSGDASNSYASTTSSGVTRLSVAPVDSGIPIAVGTNDPRLQALGNAATIQYVDQKAIVVTNNAAVYTDAQLLTTDGLLRVYIDQQIATRSTPVEVQNNITIALNGLMGSLTAPYDISMFISGQMQDTNEISSGALIVRSISIKSTGPHTAIALVAATLLSTYDIINIINGVHTVIGTLQFNANSTIGTLNLATSTLQANSIIALKVTSLIPDATLANIFITIVGCALLQQCII